MKENSTGKRQGEALVKLVQAHLEPLQEPLDMAKSFPVPGKGFLTIGNDSWFVPSCTENKQQNTTFF